MIVNASTNIYTAQVNLYQRWTAAINLRCGRGSSLDIWASLCPWWKSTRLFAVEKHVAEILSTVDARILHCPRWTCEFCIIRVSCTVSQ